MSDLTARFAEIVGTHNLLTGDAIPENYCHDAALTTTPQKPACLPDYQVDLDNIYQYMGNPRMTGSANYQSPLPPESVRRIRAHP